MKKGFLRGLVFGLLAAMLVALCACGSPDSGNPDDSKAGQTVTEKKIELSQAIDNYNQKTVKRIDATADATFSLYVKIFSPAAEKKDVAARIGVTRVVDEDKYYDKAELLPVGKSDDSVIGIVNLVKDQVPALAEFADGLIDFLNDDLTAFAEMGMIGSTCNLKAQYQNKSDKGNAGDVWYVFDAQSAASLAGLDIKADMFAKTFLSESLLGRINLQGADDSAAKRVDAEGVASYDLELNNDVFSDNIATVILGRLTNIGVELDSVKAQALAKAINTVKKWITFTATNLTAKVNKDQLPQNMKMGVTVNIDVRYNDFRDMMNNLAKAGFLDGEKAKSINEAVFGLSKISRSSKGEGDDERDRYVGLAFSVNLEEKFSYEQAKCDTTKQDSDLFIAEDVETGGRINLVNEIKEVAENEVDSLIEAALNKYVVAKEEVENIVAEVIEELDFSQKVTVSMVLDATVKVCKRHRLEVKAETETQVEVRPGEEDEQTGEEEPEE